MIPCDRNCTELSPDERDSSYATVRDDRCYVANLHDLIGLLRHLRRKFPYPISVFTVRAVAH
jgi:hypothetical protein